MNSTSLLTCLFCIIAGINCNNDLVDDTFNVISKDCKTAIQTDIDYCHQQSQSKWKSTYVKLNNQKSDCCSDWDMLDCFVVAVKAKCYKNDVDKLNEQNLRFIKSDYYQICYNYRYYSSKCTITEKDIKTGTPDEEMKKLITIPIASNSCQDEVKKSSGGCAEKVAKEFGYNRDDLNDPKQKLKIECCLKFKMTDCFLDKAKATDKCNHQDVNGLVSIYEEINEKRTNNECKDYPYGSVQCNNNSYKLGTNIGFTFLLILISSLNFM